MVIVKGFVGFAGTTAPLLATHNLQQVNCPARIDEVHPNSPLPRENGVVKVDKRRTSYRSPYGSPIHLLEEGRSRSSIAHGHISHTAHAPVQRIHLAVCALL